jgi:hypothetical protein
MPRNRVIYQNEALYVGPSPAISGHYKFVTGSYINVPTQKLNQLDPLASRTLASGNSTTNATVAIMQGGLAPNLANLDRVQSINYNFNVARRDVNQFGNLAAIDRIIIDQPVVNIDFNYYQNGFKNEKELGFTATSIKRSAAVNLTVSASGQAEFGITAASIVDGGQGYLGPFTLTLPQVGLNVPPVLSFGVATGGLYAGQATGVLITNAGSGAIFVNSSQVAAPNSYTNVPVNVGIGGTSNVSTFSPTLANNYAEGTSSIVDITCLSGILTKASDERNLFVRTVPQGNDVSIATTGTLDQAIIAFGNAVVTNYSVNAAVGDIPNVAVSYEARNFSIVTGSNDFKSSVAGKRYPLPSIDENGARVNGTYSLPDFNSRSDLSQNVSAFRPGGIILDLTPFYASGGLGIDTRTSSLNAQSFTLSMGLSRESLNRLGNTFNFAKEITFPISYSFSVNVLVSEIATGNLIDVVQSKDIKFDASVSFIKPGTEISSLGRVTGARYFMKSAQLESLDFSSSIGANKTATLTFGGQMSSPQDSTKGVFMQGDYWMQRQEII